MERDQALDSDVLVKLGERPLIAFVAAQIIARGERMLGIKTKPQPVALLHRIENTSHLGERTTEIAPLPCRYLERQPGIESRAGFVRLVDRARNRRNAGCFARANV